MLANAMTEEFEYIELFGKPVLFTTARVEKATVPKGWYQYEIRGSDYDPEKFCTIEPRVIVNHAGTILSPEEIPLQDSESRRYIRGQENFLDEYMTLAEFCACHDLPIPENPQKYLVRPASPEEAGLFYAQTPEQDEALGAIGHVRIDFGHGGKEFWHTWHPRGAEELNSPEFKAELDEVVGQLRESVLQDLSSMHSYGLLDVLDKTRVKDMGELYVQIEEYHRFPQLASLLEGEVDLCQLNALAQKLSELDDWQSISFEGLVNMEVEKQEPFGIPRLIDLAYSADCCYVAVDVEDDAALGKFYAENGFVPKVENLPDEVFEQLDFQKIGRDCRTGECGVFTSGGYVVQHTELAESSSLRRT